MGKDNRGKKIPKFKGTEQEVSMQYNVLAKQLDEDAKAALESFPAAPRCVRCSKVVDSRFGSSLPFPKGARASQRQGYMHDDCLLQAEQEWNKRGEMKLRVPTYSEEELEMACSKGSKS